MAGTPFGNSQWGDREDIQNVGGFSFSYDPKPKSFLLGRWCDFSKNSPHPMHQAIYEARKYCGRNDKFLSYEGDGHIITVAPTRSGKGVGMLIPNLLNYDESVIVIDPKGENYEKTSDYRADELSQNYWCFDPFRVKMKCDMHGFDVLKRVNTMFEALDERRAGDTSSFAAEVSRIAEAMVMRKRDEKDPFFSNAAQILIKDSLIMIMFEANNEKRVPRLSDIRRFVNGNRGGHCAQAIIDEVQGKSDEGGELIQKECLASDAANEYLEYSMNRDAMSTFAMQTEFLEDQNVAEMLNANKYKCSQTFYPDMLNGSEKHSVYIIIPPQYLNRQARFLRLIIMLCMDAVMRRNTITEHLGAYHNILFMLDEIAQLGQLDSLQKAIALAAGYKMTIWMFWQDLSQLKGLYPEDWMTFLSNAKIQQFFGCNDMETAKYVSERCGTRTQANYQQNEQYSTHGWHADVSSGITSSKAGAELIRAAEVLRADNNILFHFTQGTFPFLCEKIRYYEDEPFKGRKTN